MAGNTSKFMSFGPARFVGILISLALFGLLSYISGNNWDSYTCNMPTWLYIAIVVAATFYLSANIRGFIVNKGYLDN